MNAHNWFGATHVLFRSMVFGVEFARYFNTSKGNLNIELFHVIVKECSEREKNSS